MDVAAFRCRPQPGDLPLVYSMGNPHIVGTRINQLHHVSLSGRLAAAARGRAERQLAATA